MYDDLIRNASETFDVPAPWIKAVIRVESNWNANAYRAEPRINDGSYGLMQVLLRTARGLGFAGDASELFDPVVNIPLGTGLLGNLRRQFGDDFRRVYSAYNSGDPDAWQTSAQVGANVARALAALAEYSPVTAGPSEFGGVVVVAVVVLWAWGRNWRLR